MRTGEGSQEAMLFILLRASLCCNDFLLIDRVLRHGRSEANEQHLIVSTEVICY